MSLKLIGEVFDKTIFSSGKCFSVMEVQNCTKIYINKKGVILYRFFSNYYKGNNDIPHHIEYWELPESVQEKVKQVEMSYRRDLILAKILKKKFDINDYRLIGEITFTVPYPGIVYAGPRIDVKIIVFYSYVDSIYLFSDITPNLNLELCDKYISEKQLLNRYRYFPLVEKQLLSIKKYINRDIKLISLLDENINI